MSKPNEKKKKVVNVVFEISVDHHKKMTDAIAEIKKDDRFPKYSIRSFCKTALATLIKNYKKVYGLKEKK